MVYGKHNDRHKQAEDRLKDGCKHMQNKHFNRNAFKVFQASTKEQHVDTSMGEHRNADNAVQVRLNNKHVDINMDRDQKGRDEWCYTLGASKQLCARLFNRLHWSQNENKHRSKTEYYLYENDNNHTLWNDTQAEQLHQLINNKGNRNYLAQIIRERGPDQAKTLKPFGGTDGDELFDGKCKGAGRRT
eukprot:10581463-Heterocapsa_arctica.AAC.1